MQTASRLLLAGLLTLLGATSEAHDRAQAKDWAGRGRARWNTDKAGAIDDYSRALQADPTYHEGRYDRTLLYMETDRARDAMADLKLLEAAGFEGAKKIRALMMAICGAHTSIAGGFLEEGRPQAAIDKLAVVLTYDPAYADAFVVRGIARVHQGRLKEAMADYDRGIALDPRSPEAFHNRGLLHARNSDHRLALADFSRAIALEPHEPSNYAERGAAHAALGNAASARSDLETSARLASEALARGNDQKPPQR